MEEKREWTRRMILLIVLAVLAVLVWGYNLFRLKNISYEGLERYHETEMTALLQDSFFMTCTPVFCLADTFWEKDIPFVETYEISYEDRNSVRVIVYEKRVVGCVELMGRYMYFDKDGIVVESTAKLLKNIPVIEGLEFKEIVLHKELEIQKQSLFNTILELTRLIDENGITVQKIMFSSDYQVTLYSDEMKIQLGKRTSYDEPLNALKGILKAAGERYGTLDMRNYSKENPDVILKQ